MNRLKGSLGDKLNATLAAIAYNLRMILKVIFYFIILLLIFTKYPERITARKIPLVNIAGYLASTR